MSANSTVISLRSPSSAARETKNLIGDVLGRVVLGRSEAWILFDRLERMPALQTEPGRRGDLAAAIATASVSGVAHSSQNLALAVFSAPTLRAFHSKSPKTKTQDKIQAGSNTRLPSRSIGDKAIVPVPGRRQGALVGIVHNVSMWFPTAQPEVGTNGAKATAASC